MWNALAPVLRRLDQAEVTLNLSERLFNAKCAVAVLGHVWSAGQLTPKPSRIATIQGMARALRLKDMQCVTAAVSTLQTYIPKCAELLRPLHRACNASTRIKWSEEWDSAWQALLTAASICVELTQHRPGEKLIVRTDASLLSWAAVLYVVREEQIRPVVFLSCAWGGAEAKYHSTVREALVLLHGVGALQTWIAHEPRVIYQTDNQPVAAILHHPHQSPADKLSIVAHKPSELRVKEGQIVHVPGLENALADWASRSPNPEPSPRGPLGTQLSQFLEHPPILDHSSAVLASAPA